jgi:S-layer homology domain
MTVAVRFRISTDGAATGETWWIDDLAITNVQIPGACTAGIPGLEPKGLTTDAESFGTGTSNANGVLEPGEQVRISPTWHNGSPAAIAANGTASALTGPDGATYSLLDATAAYGTIAAGADGTSSSDSYGLGISDPPVRPAAHWDLTFVETLSTGTMKTWPLHVGWSFTDVPTGHWACRFVETIFHNGITAGCGSGFCPATPLSRAAMAVFLLMAEHGSAYVPPASAGSVFSDVPVDHWAGDFIETLASEGITSGCGGGKYCPVDLVTRAEMSVFLTSKFNLVLH